MTEDARANLIMDLNQEFRKDEDVLLIKSQKVQKYSEATKTLYTDEEVAKEKVKPILPEKEEPEPEPEKSIDELITVYMERKALYEDGKTPRKRGTFMGSSEKSDWHSGRK